MKPVDISVVIPVKNGGHYFRLCLSSLLEQNFAGTWEVSIYDDGSTDETPQIVEEYAPQFRIKGVEVIFNRGATSGGVGFAKNRAAEAGSGSFLCFSDADDISCPNRLQEQFDTAISLQKSKNNALVFIGSNFKREPSNSTERYTRWANSLVEEQLQLQIFTSNGPTLIAPTWFISKELYYGINGFKEIRLGFPEDLDFFFRALDAGSSLQKVENELVIYRYHPSCASFGVSEDIIWNMRIDRLRKLILPAWNKFTIWNAGKQGKKLFKCLEPLEKNKVVAFCDIDSRKIKHGHYEEYCDIKRRVNYKIPVIHVKDATPPLIVCVKLDMTDGNLEKLIVESGWIEGNDYILFS